MLVGVVIVMLQINLVLTLVTMAVTPLFYVIIRGFGRRMDERSRVDNSPAATPGRVCRGRVRVLAHGLELCRDGQLLVGLFVRGDTGLGEAVHV